MSTTAGTITMAPMVPPSAVGLTALRDDVDAVHRAPGLVEVEDLLDPDNAGLVRALDQFAPAPDVARMGSGKGSRRSPCPLWMVRGSAGGQRMDDPWVIYGPGTR
jgi:hypothetical protein